jgi:hypothetical protein
MAVFLRSFAAFSLVLQLSVSSLVFAMEKKEWGISDETEGGQGVVRVAPVPGLRSFEVKQLLESAALTCITLQNIQYALIKFRYDLGIIRTALSPRPKSFLERRENSFYRGNPGDDVAYAQYLYQQYYADAMEKLYPYATALVSSQMNRTTPTVFRRLAGPPPITVKQNTAQVYGDYLEKRISMGDTAALLLKLEGLENETLGFEKDQVAADALRRDLVVKGLLQEERKPRRERKKKIPTCVSAPLAEVGTLSAAHHTLFDIKNLIEKMGGRVVVTTRKKKKILKIDVTLQGQSQAFYQQGDKRARKRQLEDFTRSIQ